jgi:hypothetical protein
MFSVFVTDDGMTYEQAEQHFSKLDAWAKKNCKSYYGYHAQDVADFSPVNDLIAQFAFEDQKDLMWFKLKWK